MCNVHATSLHHVLWHTKCVLNDTLNNIKQSSPYFTWRGFIVLVFVKNVFVCWTSILLLVIFLVFENAEIKNLRNKRSLFAFNYVFCTKHTYLWFVFLILSIFAVYKQRNLQSLNTSWSFICISKHDFHQRNYPMELPCNYVFFSDLW
jgi:hypothetical protein